MVHFDLATVGQPLSFNVVGLKTVGFGRNGVDLVEPVIQKARLTGSQEASLDERGRITIPTKFIESMKKMTGIEQTDELEVAAGISAQGELTIYPAFIWNDLMDKLDAKAENDVKALQQRDWIHPLVEVQTLDKQGRCRFNPKAVKLMKFAGKLEIIGRGQYLAVVEEKLQEQEVEAGIESARQNRYK